MPNMPGCRHFQYHSSTATAWPHGREHPRDPSGNVDESHCQGATIMLGLDLPCYSLLLQVNHHKKKALYLKEMTSMLVEQFSGQVPNTEVELKQLKGALVYCFLFCACRAMIVRGEQRNQIANDQTDQQNIQDIHRTTRDGNDNFHPFSLNLQSIGLSKLVLQVWVRRVPSCTCRRLARQKV